MMNVQEPPGDSDLIKHTSIISPYTRLFEPNPSKKDKNGKPVLRRRRMLEPF